MAPPRLASEYIHQNVYLGVSFASKWDVERRDVVAEGHWMWGSDFPHDEATTPYTLEHLRISMEGVPTQKRRLLAGTQRRSTTSTSPPSTPRCASARRWRSSTAR